MGSIRYSIKDFENFTQIKAHTIRIWEQRYGLLKPKRTDTNIRYYNEDDLKKILNINLLYNSGIKISKIALLSEAQIVKKAKELILIEPNNTKFKLDELILRILDFDGTAIKQIMNNELENDKLDDLYENIILPLLHKIGLLWQVNSFDVIHEHYFSSIFREFVIGKIDSINVDSNNSKKAILFLHDNEEHEFGILIYYYILKRSGYNCHYFGQKVPIEEIMKAYDQIMPQIVISTFTAKLSEKKFVAVESVLRQMTKYARVIISGSQLKKLNHDFSDELHCIESIEEFKTILN